jgi:DNA-binding transcriptional ArsR family regulator
MEQVMKAVKVISDPRAFELLADDTRRRMIYLLRAKELTVSQLAQELDKTPQNIYHHIRKLLDGDLVEVTREEKIENFSEKYYRATAEIFEVTHGEGDEELDETEAKEFLVSMSKAGLLSQIDDQIASRAVKLLKRARSISHGSDLAEKLEKLDDAGLAIKLHAVDYAQILLMNDKQFEEYQRLQKGLRDLLTKASSRD